MKLNAEQIKRALECCNSEGHICGKCPYESVRIGISCRDKLIRDALALINSQEQRIKELTEENERLITICETKIDLLKKTEAENERLMRDKTNLECIVTSARNLEKSDTVRKMQERLTSCFCPDCDYSGHDVRRVIDQIAKEMLEDKQCT